MTDITLYDWWKKLDKHWKKVLLVNYDLFYNFKISPEKIENKIFVKGEFNAYFLMTNRKIKDLYSSFNPTVTEIQKIISIPYLTLRHISVSDIETLLIFDNLKFLTLVNFSLKSLTQIGEIKTLEKLRLIDCSYLEDLRGIEKMEKLLNLELVYCYSIKNIDDIANSISLKEVDISDIGRLVPLNFELNKVNLIIHKNNLHPDDKYYNKKFNMRFRKFNDYYQSGLEYTLDDKEVDMIVNSENTIIRENYKFLFESSKKNRIGIIDYDKWEIKTVGNKL